MRMVTTVSCRTVQAFVRLDRKLHPQQKQTVETGPGSLYDLGQTLRDLGLRRPMAVFGAVGEDIKKKTLDLLEREDVDFALWEELPAQPTVAAAEALYTAFLDQQRDGFVVIGDGPVIDAVKVAAARTVSGGWTVAEMAGRRRLPRRKVPPVVAVPTAGGGGAECVAAAVIAGPEGELLEVQGAAIMPAAALLDAELLADTGRDRVADAGLNGLCRAVEAYLAAGAGDRKTKNWAAQAADQLFENLEECWNSGGDSQERSELLSASRLSARAYAAVGGGYARALIHAVQSVCKRPFREACAIMLPAVLEKYGSYAEEPLAELADRIGLAEGGGRAERAASVAGRIRSMVFRMGLPETLEDVNADQVAEAADLAAAMANPRCVSPVVWTAEDCHDLILSVCARSGRDT